MKRRGITVTPDVPEVTASVLDIKDIAANVMGDLGTGEGALLLNMLSRAAKQNVAEMRAAGQPGAQLSALRVGKLVAAIREERIQQWDSLPPEVQAMPDVVEAAIQRLLITTPEQWNSLPAEVRADKDVVLAAIRKESFWFLTREQWWNSLPAKVQAMPDVVEAAIQMLLIYAPEQWHSLAAEVRADKDVVLAAIREHLPLQFLTCEQWWNLLPAKVQAMPDVVEAAIQMRLITTREQWNSLPAEVRAEKQVVLAAIRRPVLSTPEQWNLLPAEVRADKDVVLAAIREDPFSRAGGFLTREQWWNSLPAKVQAMSDVVAAAIQRQLITTPEQWNSLPTEVRAEKQVVLAAIDQSRQRRVFKPSASASFFDSRGDGYSLSAFSQDEKQDFSDLFFAGIGGGESEEVVLAAVRNLSELRSDCNGGSHEFDESVRGGWMFLAP
eukprot:g12535.t1